MTSPAVVPAGSLGASLVRTAVPILVGYVVSLAARHGWHVNDDQAASTITALVAWVYYALVRVAETKGNVKFGWLLGLARQPFYAPAITEARSSGSLR